MKIAKKLQIGHLLITYNGSITSLFVWTFGQFFRWWIWRRVWLERSRTLLVSPIHERALERRIIDEKDEKI